MRVMKYLVGMMVLLPSLHTAAEIASSRIPMPPGIGVQLAMVGPVFVDDKGMTLYVATEGVAKACDNSRHHVVLGALDFTVTVPDVEMRRTCVQKRPPLLAPDDAKPVGKWSILPREDGLRQWTYDGKPLHTSIKDKRPGEVNGTPAPTTTTLGGGSWNAALAPLHLVTGTTPAGVTTGVTHVGLALVSPAGKTLYYPDRDEAAANPQLWQPFVAPVLARADRSSDWSIVTHGDGSQQWAYKGRPLYTYMHDTSKTFGLSDIFGGAYGRRIEGWHVALLKEPSGHPAEVITVNTVVESHFLYYESSQKRIYTTAEGITLYTLYCFENTDDSLDCDDVGDNPSYWLKFCGGEERCAKTWRPLIASAGAKPIGEWSVITINPRHPWRAVEKGTRGLRVWAHKGRPVFTYAPDSEPGSVKAVTLITGLVQTNGFFAAGIITAITESG